MCVSLEIMGLDGVSATTLVSAMVSESYRYDAICILGIASLGLLNQNVVCRNPEDRFLSNRLGNMIMSII